MEIPLLNDVVVIFVLSIAVTFICHRFKLPAIVGFLLTGILAGPHGLGLVSAVHEVEILAEIGVVLLLFTIGMEFSLSALMAIKKQVLLGGSLQVILTTGASALVAHMLGRPVNESIFIGFFIALSSTAIVLKLLQERAEMDTPNGRNVLGILIFQDIAVVPMMLLAPLLAGTGGDSQGSVWIFMGKAVGLILLVIASAKWIVPQMLYQVARTRFREVFLLTIVAICLSIAWITAHAGLSLALGAFLAGLIISESEYSHQALGNVMPLRDVFTSFFFVSIGMLLDVRLLYQIPVAIASITFGIVAVKFLFAGSAAYALGVPLRTAVMTGLALAQVGEFSFILAVTGVEAGLLPAKIYQVLLACSVLSMALAPLFIAAAPRLAELTQRLPISERIKRRGAQAPGAKKEKYQHHLVIVGYGVNGRNMARAADMAGILYVIIEMNPDTVRREKAKGVPILYGDATQEAVLEHVRIDTAKVVVIAINDNTATRRITEIIRRLGPKAHLIVRTRFFEEMGPLYALGANEVIPEEFETSVEIFSRVLGKYLIPREDIERFVSEVRAEGYKMFRSLSRDATAFADLGLDFPDVEINSFRISKGAVLDGKTLAQSELRKKHGVTVLAVRRDSRVMTNPDGETVLNEDDLLFVLGKPNQMAEAGHLFK